ncbi:MAG: YbaK/EbsC family protein [Proteobacteria bacterium]|nr:YbaK/EbsC family protein [Pseudomonadota bacterium]
MAISSTLSEFLDQQKVAFALIPHPHTSNSMDTARQAHVPGKRLAKAVVVKEDGNYSMVIVPSVEQVDLVLLREQIGHGVKLATESELGELFPDCAIGAVPPVGAAWGLDTYLDECFLEDDEEVFFEAGDHEDLVRVTGDQFQKLLGNVKSGRYGHTI